MNKFSSKSFDKIEYSGFEYYSKIWNYLKWLKENKAFIIQSTGPLYKEKISEQIYDYIRHAENLLARLDSVLQLEFEGEVTELQMITDKHVVLLQNITSEDRLRMIKFFDQQRFVKFGTETSWI